MYAAYTRRSGRDPALSIRPEDKNDMGLQMGDNKRYVGRTEFYFSMAAVFCFMLCALMAARSKTQWFPMLIMGYLLVMQIVYLALAFRRMRKNDES